MKNEAERRIDALFDEAWEQGKDIPVPDSTESWNRVRAIVEKRNRKIRLRRNYAMAAAMFASLLAGAIIFGAPQVSRAFMPIFQSFKQIQGSVVNLFFSGGERNTEGARTPPPPDYDPNEPGTSEGSEGNVTPKMTKRFFTSLDDASHYTNLLKKNPKYIPDGYALNKVELNFNSRESISNLVNITYESIDSDGWMKLTIQGLEIDEKFFTTPTPTQVLQHEEIEINGSPAYYILGQDQTSKIEWMISGVRYLIISTISKDELVKVAESIY